MLWRAVVAIILLVLTGRSSAQAANLASDIRAGVATVGDGGLTDLFYRQRNYSPAWSSENDQRQALAAMERAAENGLDPDRYRIGTRGDAVSRDVFLTTTLIQYMRDLSVGRLDLQKVDSDVALPGRSFDAPAILARALREGDLSLMLAGLGPRHADYALLKRGLARSSEGPARYAIIANMERWRWLPAELEPDRIVVNVTDAQLQLWLGGKIVLTSRVIVGRPRNPTPILRAQGAGLTLNPAWTIPHSIAVKEILPKLKANHAYLAKQDMVLLDGPANDPHGLNVNWRAIPPGTFPYQIRQYPGPRNPLGRIKIELPNRFDVYLHDTPGKEAFAKPNRALSHGCVRVEQILPLASYALSANLGTIEKISQGIDAGETKYLPLHKTLPVYFLYWTVFVGADGELQFRRDLYGRDQRLIAAMKIRPPQIAGNLPSCPRG